MEKLFDKYFNDPLNIPTKCQSTMARDQKRSKIRLNY